MADRESGPYRGCIVPIILPPKWSATMSRPVFRVHPHGRLANQMIQYLVALKFVDLLGGDCDISGVKLPAWGIHHPKIESPGPVASYSSEHHMQLDSLVEKLRTGQARRVD